MEVALHFDGIPVDGPFQLFNALRRMAAGQHLGADFQFFHGAGIPLLHYLPFRALGGDLAASELTRQLISVLAGPVVLLAFFRAFTESWTRTWALTTAVTAALIAFDIAALLEPGFSLVAVRSAVPLLVPIVLHRTRSTVGRVVGAGLATGAAALMSTEQGLALAAAYVVTQAVVALRSRDIRRVGETVLTIVVAAATVVLTLVIMGGVNGAKAALEYNYRLVPMDQYWFFGAPPSHVGASWHGMALRFTEYPAVAIILGVGFILAVHRIQRTRTAVDAPLSILVLHGLISCASLLGYFDPVYVAPCFRMLLIIGALELDRRFGADRFMVGIPRRLAIAAGIAIAAGVLAGAPRLWLGVRDAGHLASAHLVGRTGVVWSKDWQQTMQIDRQLVASETQRLGRKPVVWSTYSGWLESDLGEFNPASDYLIHALGPAGRQTYLDVFRSSRPDLVQTVAPRYTDHELFLEQTWWDLYAELLRNYMAVSETHWSLLWTRSPTTQAWPAPYWSQGSWSATGDSLYFQAPAATDTSLFRSLVLLEIELDFRVENRASWVPVVGHMARYFAKVSDGFNPYPTTIDPYRSTVRFPVIVARNGSHLLTLESHSLLGGASIRGMGVRIREVPVSRENTRWLSRVIRLQSRFLPGVRDIIY